MWERPEGPGNGGCCVALAVSGTDVHAVRRSPVQPTNQRRQLPTKTRPLVLSHQRPGQLPSAAPSATRQHRRELEIHWLLGLKRLATRSQENRGHTWLLRARNQSQRNPISCTHQATPTRRVGTSTSEVHFHVEKCELLQECFHALTCELCPLSKPAWREIQKQPATTSPAKSNYRVLIR